MKNYVVLALGILLFTHIATAQTATTWNGKSCAVVLTYDDAIDIDLDNVVPALDSQKLKGTFYLIGATGIMNTRMTEWRAAAKKVMNWLTIPCFILVLAG